MRSYLSSTLMQGSQNGVCRFACLERSGKKKEEEEERRGVYLLAFPAFFDLSFILGVL